MDLGDLVAQIPDFATWSHPERVKLFGWHLHAHEARQRFDQQAIRACYDALHYDKPGDVSVIFYKLQKRKPPELLRDAGGYRLEGRVRAYFDGKYGRMQSVVIVDTMLAELPGRISTEAERVFLSEALTCYRYRAFRAAIVMTWNLAYDHLLAWLLADPSRMAAFNASLPGRVGAKRAVGLVLHKREDFEDLKESEVIDVCRNAHLIAKNMSTILNEKLGKRNMAAHPSTVEITYAQANDVIIDLVTNVILKLS